MNRDVYDILALVGRYVFAVLMVVIVLRAWRITIVDNRRARKLRQLAPATGLSGELVVLEGGEKAPEGTRYPVIREGIIGSSRKADVRVRHKSVRRVHAFFELTDAGLRVRTHGNADMSLCWEVPVRELLLGDGDTFEIGNVQLMVVLTEAQGGARHDPAEDDFFSVRPERPAARKERAARPKDPFDEDEFDA